MIAVTRRCLSWVEPSVSCRRGDASVSELGDEWHRDVAVHFDHAQAVFPSESGPVDGGSSPAPTDHDPLVRAAEDHDPLVRAAEDHDPLVRAAEVWRLRNPSATVTEVRTGADGRFLGYLRVRDSRAVDPQLPVAVEEFPIGLVTGTPTEDDLDRFAGIDARFRVCGATTAAKLVYTGDAAPPALRTRGRRKGIELLSFAQYQLGYDLRPYVARQSEQLGRHPQYRPELYIPQRYTDITAPTVAQAGQTGHDLLERVRDWLADPDGHLVAALVPLAGGGRATLLPDLSYKVEGAPSGEFWYTIGACRFEPGDLDPYLNQLRRLPAERPILEVGEPIKPPPDSPRRPRRVWRRWSAQ